MQPDKEFLIKLAQSGRDGLSSGESEQVDLLSRRKVERPLVMVNSSTSGIVAGANRTWKAIEQYSRLHQRRWPSLSWNS